jgi:hypothetical protein
MLPSDHTLGSQRSGMPFELLGIGLICIMIEHSKVCSRPLRGKLLRVVRNYAVAMLRGLVRVIDSKLQ